MRRFRVVGGGLVTIILYIYALLDFQACFHDTPKIPCPRFGHAQSTGSINSDDLSFHLLKTAPTLQAMRK